eukprot:Transcript_8349.p1 GENE.Transcript_8349~~Transcript_8349.p1  ORF type:complete len:488 (-),score=199.32 Transcript_8349:1456-2919(-)
MQKICMFVGIATASAFGSSGSKVQLSPYRKSGNQYLRSPAVTLEDRSTLYDEYMRSREEYLAATGQAVAPPPMPQGAPAPPPMMNPEDQQRSSLFFRGAEAFSSALLGGPSPQAAGKTDTDFDEYERVPWWKQSGSFTEEQRKDRRTVFMHDDWVRHRSSQRFLRNIQTIGSSGINQALSKELAFVTGAATFIVVMNMLLVSYQDLGGVSHVGPMSGFLNIKSLSLPALPFSIAMPALSLLLVFRTNTGYFRWNEARTLWGGLINNCRNVVRQANTFFPDDPKHDVLKRRIAAETAAFCMALRNFLRGPSDDETLRSEVQEYVNQGLIPAAQLDAMMAAANRPCFALSAMSATMRKADIDPMHSSRMDSTFSILLDITGANERIFKSPIPLVYTRHSSRFLTFFNILLPLGIWPAMGEYWNHWVTLPTSVAIALFLFGIEEIGVQIEEPFSILPIEAFCNGAITAHMAEMNKYDNLKVIDSPIVRGR